MYFRPEFWTIKDPSSIYRDLNDKMAQAFGFKSKKDVQNITDFDLPYTSKESAFESIKLDQIVINEQKTLQLITVAKYADGWKMLYGKKEPIKTPSGASEGIFYSSSPLPGIIASVLYTLLQPGNMKSLARPKAAHYILNDFKNRFNLTPRQHECLFFLVRGKPIRQIAIGLNLSVRTVEGYIDEAKRKLYCNSKSELIDRLCTEGFIFHLPPSIFQFGLSKL